MATIGSRFSTLPLDAHDPLEKGPKKNKKHKSRERQKARPPTSPKPAASPPPSPQVPATKVVTVVVKDITRSQPEKPQEKATQLVESKGADEGELEKDDRAVRARSTYKKLIVNRGRVLDRHGGSKTSVRPQEKRQGHGQYNWGSTMQTENQAEPQEVTEVQPPLLTLEQYKDLVKGDKVDPLAWENQVPLTQEASENDVGQYFYRYDDRGRGLRRPNRGRGSTRGGARSVNHSERPVETVAVHQPPVPRSQLNVDDFSSFPAL